MIKHCISLTAMTLLMALLCSCDADLKRERDDARSKAYLQGYDLGHEHGKKSALKDIIIQSKNIRGYFQQKMLEIMLWCSTIFLACTLFGARVIEFFKDLISIRFKMPLRAQLYLANIIYTTTFLGMGVWMLSHHSLAMNIPVCIVLLGSTYPFFGGVIPAMTQKNKTQFRFNVQKVKALFLFALASIMMYRIFESGIWEVLQ